MSIVLPPHRRRLALTAALASCALWFATIPDAGAVSTLAAGDVAIVGFNGKETDSFAFVTLVDIDGGAGVQLRFDSSEGYVLWSPPAGGVVAGTVVVVLNPKDGDTAASDNVGGTVTEAGYNYNSDFDTILITQGATPLYASSTVAGYTPPAGLSFGENTAVSRPTGAEGWRNARYTGSHTGLREQILSNLANTANWEHNAGDTAFNLNLAPYTNPYTLGAGDFWSSTPIDGYYFYLFRGQWTGATLAARGLLATTQTDNNDALTSAFAGHGTTIAANRWMSVHFTNTCPPGAALASVKIRVQHQGTAGLSGTFQIHVSPDRSVTHWYNGGTGASTAHSADLAWSDTEGESEYEAIGVLDTSAKVNSCEILLLCTSSSGQPTDLMYIDWIQIEAIYLPSGEPAIHNTGANPIAAASATLNGQLTQGSPRPRVLLFWGDEPGGPVLSGGWDHTVDLGLVSVGPFSHPLSGLLANKTYYYRCYASNTLGTTWAPTNTAFTTAPPTLQFSPATASVAEEEAVYTVSVTLSAESVVPVSFTVGASGSATAGADYTFAGGLFTIPAGRTSTNLTFAIHEDALDEPDEQLVLTLSSPINGVLATTPTYTHTIIDDDSPPTVSFTGLPYQVTEGAGPATLLVALSAPSGHGVSVQYRTQDGTALAGSDYSNTVGLLTWPAGDTANRTIQVPIIDDSVSENDKQFSVELYGPTNTVVAGTNPAPVNIIDNDFGPPSIRISAGATAVSSNAATLRGELVSRRGADTTAWFFYGPSPGGESPAAWSNNVPMGIVTEGPLSNRVVNLARNTTYYYRCLASNSFGLVWTDMTTNFLTGPPTVAFASASTSNPESVSPVILDVLLSNPSVYGEDIFITYERTGGAATPGVDFTLHGTSATIPAGRSATNITLTIVNDALDENNETARITLTSVSNANLGAPATNTVTIVDDDPLPLIAFLNTPYVVNENAGSVTVRVGLSPVSGRFVDVDYATADASALDGDDYDAVSGRLTWSAGETTVYDIVIPIHNDEISQGDRYFEFRLSAPGFADFADDDRINITILEDDTTPPAVENRAASNVRARQARMHGAVVAGIPYPNVLLYWGLTDGGTTPSAWAHTNNLGTQSGDFSIEVTGLEPLTTYRYRAFVDNGGGTAWAPSTTNFTTTGAATYFLNDNSLTDDVYCAAVGNNTNSGTSAAAPMATLRALLNKRDLEPGDTVYLDTGIYTDTTYASITNMHRGNATSNVLFRGSTHPAGSVLRSTSTSVDVLRMPITGDAFIVLENLRFTGGNRGFWAYGTSGTHLRGLTMRNCRAYDNRNSVLGPGGLIIQYADNVVVEQCQSLNNGVMGLYLDTCDGVTAVDNTCLGNREYGIRSRYGSNIDLRGNVSGGHTKWGIEVFGAGGVANLVDSQAFSNAWGGASVDGADGMITDNHLYDNGADGLVLAGPGNRVEGNVIHDNAKNGLTADGDEGGLLIRHNVFYDNGATNVFLRGVRNVVMFENNTLSGGSGVLFYSPGSVTNRHNIFWADGAGARAIDVPYTNTGAYGMLSDYNSLYVTGGAQAGRWAEQVCATPQNWKDITWKDPNSIEGDPRFVEAARGDYHLQSKAGSYHGGLWNVDPTNSPCIDAGDPGADFDNEPSYNGLRRNLGAYGNTAQASITHYDGPMYSLTLNVSPPEAGTAHAWPPGGLYPANFVVTIWADPANEAYHWNGWSGTINSASVTSSFAIVAHSQVTAMFSIGTSNTNGIPDWWLAQYGLPTSQEGADEDSDLDGHANWKEFYAGTVPTNALSVLHVSDVARATAEQRDALSFPTAVGRLYRLQSSTSLPAGNWTSRPAAAAPAGTATLDPFAGTGGILTIYADPPGLIRAYRIEVEYTPDP